MAWSVRVVIVALVASVVYGREAVPKKVSQHLLRKEETLETHATLQCKGKVCEQLMDDIHFNADDNRTVRNLPKLSDGLKTIRCERGMSSCELSFTLPGSDALLETNDDSSGARDFYSIAKSKGTDKVREGVHQYQTTYQEYLGEYSLPGTAPFVMVEVGFAKGFSARAWPEFLPSAKLHEFDVHCDEEWNVMDTSPGGITGEHRDLGYCKLHCGDGSNAAFLQEALEDDEAPFIVIDDGGHGAEEMKNTFDHMWPKVKPGGLFFIEDLAESYHVDRAQAFVDQKLKPIVHDLLAPKGKTLLMKDVSSQVESIQCREQICALRKRSA